MCADFVVDYESIRVRVPGRTETNATVVNTAEGRKRGVQIDGPITKRVKLQQNSLRKNVGVR